MSYPRFYKRDKNANFGPFDGGIVIDKPEHEISDSQSPDMMNMIFSNGILKKRQGQKVLFDNGDDIINACFKEAFNGYIIYHAGERIKAYNLSTGETIIFNMYIPRKKGEFFTYNGRVYYIGAGEYYKISYEDENLCLETVEGYIPLRYINSDPDTGIGDDNESANFLTPLYRVAYNSYDDTTIVYLPHGASEDNIIVEYENAVVSSEKYTVKNGAVSFNGDVEITKGQNKLVITVSDKNAGDDREKITCCTTACCFGGTSSGISEGTRVFLSGNLQYANTLFHSALKNPEYFPIDAYDILGDTLDPVTGFGRQGGGLVIFKKNSIYFSLYEYSAGEVIFTVTNISADKGCDSKNTIRSVDNRLIWFDTRNGVMALTSTSKNNEKNVYAISENVNGAGSSKALLSKDNQEGVSAFIYQNKYHLCTKKYCYVFDYELSSYDFSNPERLRWFLYSNVESLFSVRDQNRIYLAGRRERFTYFDDCLYDFEKNSPIYAYYQTKAFDLGSPYIFKTVKDISLVLRAIQNVYTEIKCYDEDGRIKDIPGYRVTKFSFKDLRFSKFTFYGRNFAVFLRRKIYRKRVKFFSLKLINNEPLSDMAISELTVNYQAERGAKQNGI